MSKIFSLMSFIGLFSVLCFTACKRTQHIGKGQGTNNPENPENPTSQQFTLKLAKTGTGSIAASWQGGNATETELLSGKKINKDALVTLTATPNASMPNVLWNEASSDYTYTLSMTQDQTVKVAFSTTPVVTYQLSLPADGSLNAYTDALHTQSIHNLQAIKENTPIYLAVTEDDKIIANIIGIDDNSLSSDKKSAIVTMTQDKTITATLMTNYMGFILEDNGSSYTIVQYIGSLPNIDIPSSYKQKPITIIGNNANPVFSYSPKTIVIPSNIITISKNALLGCNEVDSLNLNMKDISSLGNMGSKDKLKKLTLGSNVVSLATDVFLGYDYIAFLNLNMKNISTLGNLGNKGYLKTLIIGSNVTSIADKLFEKFLNVEYLDINMKNTGSVGNLSIVRLKTCTIGSNVTHIGRPFFQNCANLTTIIVNANTPPSLETLHFAFVSCYSLAEIKVPVGKKTIYEQTVSSWNEMKDKIKEQ